MSTGSEPERSGVTRRIQHGTNKIETRVGERTEGRPVAIDESPVSEI